MMHDNSSLHENIHTWKVSGFELLQLGGVIRHVMKLNWSSVVSTEVFLWARYQQEPGTSTINPISQELALPFVKYKHIT